MGAFADSLKQTNLPALGPRQSPGGSGPFGFFGNLLGDVRDLGLGIGQLAGTAVHDVGRGLAQALPFRQDWGVLSDNPADQYRLDDIALALPGAIASDYATRYGGLSNITRGLYEHPLSYLLDALAVGSVAGKGAQLAGKAAIAGTGAASAAGTLSRELAAAGIRGAETGGIRAGLDELAQAGRLSGTGMLARALLPRASYRLVGDTFTRTLPATNPVRRLLLDTPYGRASTQPLDVLERDLGTLKADILARAEAGIKVPGEMQAAARRAGEILEQARGLGLARIERPWVAEKYGARAARKLEANLSAAFLLERQKEIARYRETIEPHLAADPSLTEKAHVILPRLDVDIEGLTPEVWAQRQGFAGTVIGGAELLDTPATAAARSARESLLSHLQSLAETEAQIRSIISRAATPKGRIRAIRQAIGEQRFRQLRSFLGDATEIDRFVEDVVQGLPEGGILRRALDPAFHVPARRGYAASIATELREALGGEEALRMVVGDAGTSAQLLHRVRKWLNQDLPGPSVVRLLPREAAAPGGGGVALRTRPMVVELDEATRAVASEAAPAFLERTEAASAPIRDFIARVEAERDALARTGWDVDAEIEGARRLQASLNEAVIRRAQASRGERVLSEAEALSDDVRLRSTESLAEQFSSFGFTPRMAFEHTYAPLRLKYGARFDDVTGELTGGPLAAELDDALREAGQVPPTYFPYISEPGRTTDFFRSRRLVGANILAADPHFKRMKGVLLSEGSYIRDPMEAFTRRAARGIRAQETYRAFAARVQMFGRPISATDELAPGYVVMAPDALFLRHRSKLVFEDVLDDLLSAGVERDEALATAIERVVLRNQDDIAEAVSAGVSKLYAVPRFVADQMEAAAKWAKVSATKEVRLFWDTPMQAWRGLVLSGSPRWVVNNLIGNVVFAAMQGVKTADVIRALAGRFRQALGQRSAFLEDLRRLPGYEDVGSGYVGTFTAQYEAKLGPAAAATRTGQFIEAARGSRPAGTFRSIGTFMRRLNAEIESGFRDASFLTAVERQAGIGAVRRTARSLWASERRVADILEGGIDEISGKLAVAEVNRFFGNYAALGPFERHVLRRFLFPFYGFYKHQLTLLARFPIELPGRAQLLRNLSGISEEMMAQYGPVPEWLESAVPMGPPGSEVSFLTSRGPNPFAGSFSPWTSMLSPPIQIAIERALGHELFTGRPFSSEDVVTPFGSDQPYQVVRDEAGNVVDVVKLEGAVLPGIGEHLLSQIPHYQAAKEAVAGGKPYDTATLADVLAGQGVIREPETGAPRYPTGLPQELLALSGLGVTPYDLARFQESLSEEQKRALAAALARFGQGG